MAPVVLMLAGVIVRATTKKALQRLMNAGFQKASSGVAKSKANIINATDDNIISLITRAKARSKTRGKVTTAKPKPKTQAEVKEALKRNAEKVSSKKFGDKKLSDLGRVGPKPKPSAAKPKSKKTSLTGVVIPLALAPSRAEDSSAPSVKKASKPTPKFKKKPSKPTPEFKKKPSKTMPSVQERYQTKLRIQRANRSDPPGKNPSTNPGVLNIVRISKEALGEKKAPPAAVVKQVVQEVPKKDKYKTETTPAEKEALRKMEAAAVKKQLSTFGKAFKSARAAKKYSFKYKGKEITTRYKEESVAEHKKKFPKKK